VLTEGCPHHVHVDGVRGSELWPPTVHPPDQCVSNCGPQRFARWSVRGFRSTSVAKIV
jgi:hypothetical protein